MKIEFLKDIVSHIAGPNSVDIVDLLYGRENVNEFLIAKKLDVTINQARNVLYKLAEEGLVSFIRKKDKKNGGWYTYFWTLNAKKSLLNLRNRLGKEIEDLERQLSSKQTKQFYYCPNCDLEISEENALYYDFICPECGEVFKAKDNSGYIEEVRQKVSGLKDRLGSVNEEIAVIEKKEEASKERKKKAEEKRKKAERDAKRKAREKEKKKLEKKLGKKGKKKFKKKSIKKKSKKKKFKVRKGKKLVRKKLSRKKKVKKKVKKKIIKGKIGKGKKVKKKMVRGKKRSKKIVKKKRLARKKRR